MNVSKTTVTSEEDVERLPMPSEEEMKRFVASKPPISKFPLLEYWIENYASLKEPLTKEDIEVLDRVVEAAYKRRYKIAMLGIGSILHKFDGFSAACDLLWRISGLRGDHIEQLVSNASDWRDAGFSQVVLGHKVAASLMATRSHEEIAGLIKAPWNVFIINVPDGLLFTRVGEDYVDVRHILVDVRKDKWSLSWFGEPRGNSHSFIRSGTGHMTLEAFIKGDDFDSARKGLIESDLVFRLAARLVVGCCLLMSDPSTVKAPKGSTYRPPGPDRPAIKPTRELQTFVVGAPVKIDCRKEITAFQLGEGGEVSVRFIVRGHWKAQPHGLGRQQRKTIWIQPYWKGEEDATTLVRPHVIKKTLEGKEAHHGKEETETGDAGCGLERVETPSQRD